MDTDIEYIAEGLWEWLRRKLSDRHYNVAFIGADDRHQPWQISIESYTCTHLVLIQIAANHVYLRFDLPLNSSPNVSPAHGANVVVYMFSLEDPRLFAELLSLVRGYLKCDLDAAVQQWLVWMGNGVAEPERRTKFMSWLRKHRCRPFRCPVQQISNS